MHPIFKQILSRYSLIFLLCLLTGFSLSAQENSSYQDADIELRAAYISAVMRYATWPNEKRKEQLTIGVMGADKLFHTLDTLFIPPVRNLPIEVKKIERNTQLVDLDILYIGNVSLQQLPSIMAIARSQHILIITEGASLREEVMINILSSQNKRLSFQVNADKIAEAGIHTTSDLILLRGTELELILHVQQKQQELYLLQQEHDLILLERDKEQERLHQAQEHIHNLELAIEERNFVLAAKEGTIEDTERLMSSQQMKLNQLLHELDGQRQLLLNRETQLNAIQRDLNLSRQELERQQRELEYKEKQLRAKQDESDRLSSQITNNKKTLQAQQDILQSQVESMNNQALLIQSREKTIAKQRYQIFFIGIGFFIAVVFAILSITLYFRGRRISHSLVEAIDKLKSTQDQLIEAEKMAALGNLVAGVAHEVNTPLGIAITATSMMAELRENIVSAFEHKKLTQKQLQHFLDRSFESLQLTERNLANVDKLITNFKQVAVDHVVIENRDINLAQYIEEVMSTLSIELKRTGVTYTIEYDEENPIHLEIAPGALAQIITNLTTNSIRHAFDEQPGHITIRLSRQDNEKDKSEEKVLIQFCDNGKGISSDVMSRLYEPFFTTKRNRGGTGLGMSIVYNIVRQKLQGEIFVQSTLNESTCFTLLLPIQARPNQDALLSSQVSPQA